MTAEQPLPDNKSKKPVATATSGTKPSSLRGLAQEAIVAAGAPQAQSYSTPSKPQARSFHSPSLSFGSTDSGGTGFFSLGESNIADRAKRLKEERSKSTNSGKKDINAGSSGGDERIVSKSSKDENEAKSEFDKASLHEFDSLLISNQTDEIDNILHRKLVEGFRSLRESRIQQDSDVLEEITDAASLITEEQRKFSATVNFIDPTTKPQVFAPQASLPIMSSDPAKAANLQQQQSMTAKRANSTSSQTSSASSVSKKIANVYESLTYIFEKDYGSTLRSVQYKNIRTGEKNTIRSLPVRPVISMNGSSSDPSEWHTGPFCHVYIAPCESVDHYRTKVRPSLKAFVSQLESTESNTTANQQGGHSADYLIVYIPIGDKSVPSTKKELSTPSASKTNTNQGRFGIFGLGRRPQASNAGGDSDDLSSKDSLDSGDDMLDMANLDDEDSETQAMNVLMTFNHLSKPERSLYKKIATNFPNGKVCILSPSSLEKTFNSEDSMAIRVQEWNVFNRLLGQVIVNGFQDRVQRYKSELKRLDAQRATAATAAKNYANKDSNDSKSPTKPNPYAFNLGHFFLVKESLASSYEQMQLPAEALLQYDEFRLYMPDLTDKDERKVRKARRKCKALMEGKPSESLVHLADSGDFLSFRKKIRTEHDLTAILDIIRRYLFARELAILFRMEQPVEILSRCESFIKIMYAIVLRGISELDGDEQQKRKTKAATWVIQFSWDVYNATKQYLRCSPLAHESSQRQKSQSDEAVAAKLSDILDISRLFLIQFAKDHQDTLRSFSEGRKAIPKDLLTPWPDWTPCEPAVDEKESNAASSPEDKSVDQNETNTRQFLATYKDIAASIDKFEEAYITLCGAIIDARQIAKHQRMSARIQAEVGEFYAAKGDLRKAAKYFQKIQKIYRLDHWDLCHFWRVFRLAYCQRTTVEPTIYLKTLCSCFSPRSAVVAPKKALAALFKDLQDVIAHPSIGNARYSRLLFIETSLSISMPSEKSEIGSILDRKEVEKRFCSVGETPEIHISIKSYLPGPIELTSVKLFAVAIHIFKSIIENGDAVQEEDAAKVLSIDAPIMLLPGNNDFTFKWSPPRPGQYILSTVEILWKEGYFYYDSMDLQDPLLCIEVMPNEPTHSISMEPTSLVPGLDQEFKITFDAGSDFVTSAKLKIFGTNDIMLIPPGEDPSASDWRQEWETILKPLQPGEKQVIVAQVRCSINGKASDLSGSQDDSADPVRALFAKVFTNYVHAPTEGEEECDRENTEATLEVFSSVLEKPFLSVESTETHWFEAPDRFLFIVRVISNSLDQFLVNEWNLNFAQPINILIDKDLNENLLNHDVFEGDQLSFVFECSIEKCKSSQADTTEGNQLKLKLCDDKGKKFWITLPLDSGKLLSTLPDIGSCIQAESILATLTLEKQQGLVGEPLALTFAVDIDDCKSLTSSDSEGDNILYSIQSTRGHWLLGGKVTGILKGFKSQKLTCIGVPVVSGALQDFPTITLERLGMSGTITPINVEIQNPESFQSMPLTEINAIATPRYEDR